MDKHEIVGLFGELFVMKEVLMPIFRNWAQVLETWKGYKAEKQDFIGLTWVLEVKANHAKAPKNLWINGVGQLRSVGNKRLFLCYLFFDSDADAGIGITDMIDSIMDALPNGQLRGRFRSFIKETGYDEALAIKWDELRFPKPERLYYDVLKDKTEYPFPRITSVDSHDRVKDLKYKLILKDLEPFLIDEKRDFLPALKP